MKLKILLIFILILIGKIYLFTKESSNTRSRQESTSSADRVAMDSDPSATIHNEVIKSESPRENKSEHQASPIKNLVLNLPTHHDWKLGRNQNEFYSDLTRNEKLVLKLFNLFRNFKFLNKEFEQQQAEARVKLIDFFESCGSQYSHEMESTLKVMANEQEFKNNFKSRQSDYIDIAGIYLKNYSDTDLKDNFKEILDRIGYSKELQPFIATALRTAHPNLFKDLNFLQQARILLTGEVI